MYNVLVVDDDSTCLVILKRYLRKWNYEVTTVTHAYDALCSLRDNSYDLVLSDVHMPNMNGFELQRRVNQEFRLPVILISSDSLAEIQGIQNGAQFFLVKPIEPEDVKNVWQISEWWKIHMKNRTLPIREINTSSPENVPRNVAVPSANILTQRTRKVVWSRNLHTRFVEAVLVLGYNKAVPKNILEIMNVPGLTREQVASHLQKYRKFLVRILDGSADLENSHWVDYNYYSSVLRGNPHFILINQLKDQQRTGKLAAPIPTGYLSSAPGGYCRPLPPYTPAETSSKRTMNANVGNTANIGNIVGSSTTSNPVQNLYYETNQMGHYNKNMLVAPHNYSYRNGGLIGGANNNMFPSANHIGTSSTVPFPNNFYSNQALNLGGQGSNNLFNNHNINGGQQRIVQPHPNTGFSFGANQFGNTSAVNGQQLGSGKMAIQNLFNGHNINGGQLTELGGVQRVSNPGISFGATNQFGNTSVVNEQQLGAGQMTHLKSGSNNNEVLSPDNSLEGLSLSQGDDGEDIWDEILNDCLTDDKDVGVANDKDDENSGDNDKDDENSRDDDDDGDDDDDDDYNPEEES